MERKLTLKEKGLHDKMEEHAKIINDAVNTIRDQAVDSDWDLLDTERLAEVVHHHCKRIQELKLQLEMIDTVRGQIENELWAEED